MTKPRPLDNEEINSALGALPAWALRDGKLYRHWQFADFSQAFGFMTRVALLAERHDHHPAWLNVYSQVEIWLETHVSNGITHRDIALATAIDRLDGGQTRNDRQA